MEVPLDQFVLKLETLLQYGSIDKDFVGLLKLDEGLRAQCDLLIEFDELIFAVAHSGFKQTLCRVAVLFEQIHNVLLTPHLPENQSPYGMTLTFFSCVVYQLTNHTLQNY